MALSFTIDDLVQHTGESAHTLLEPHELFEARRAGAVSAARLRDLVCGMELAPADVAARLTVGGTERVFCSDACLRRFVTAPDRYPE
jgi:YHS domain-containing protein